MIPNPPDWLTKKQETMKTTMPGIVKMDSQRKNVATIGPKPKVTIVPNVDPES
jgi:hypothetical protein